MRVELQIFLPRGFQRALALVLDFARIKLCDFGESKFSGLDALRIQIFRVLGRELWMSRYRAFVRSIASSSAPFQA